MEKRRNEMNKQIFRSNSKVCEHRIGIYNCTYLNAREHYLFFGLLQFCSHLRFYFHYFLYPNDWQYKENNFLIVLMGFLEEHSLCFPWKGRGNNTSISFYLYAGYQYHSSSVRLQTSFLHMQFQIFYWIEEFRYSNWRKTFKFHTNENDESGKYG